MGEIMNTIDEKYKNARTVVKVLKELRDKKKEVAPMIIETVRYIMPQTEKTIGVVLMMSQFHSQLEKMGIAVIREFGRDVSIEEIEDQITQSICTSKKNIQDVIVSHKLDEKYPQPEIKNMIDKLKRESLPQ